MGNTVLTYDSVMKDRLASVGGKAVSYSTDSSICPTSWDGKTYTFEGRRLMSVSKDGMTATYKYDDQGRRIEKKVVRNKAGGTTTNITHYMYDGSNLIAEIEDTNNRLDYIYDENGMLFGVVYNGTDKYFYVRDVLQNILGIVDSSGNLVVQYTYNAWGQVLDIIDTSLNAIGSCNPFRFKGYHYDIETGMFYCQSRYYVPEWGRWLNGDHPYYLNPSNLAEINLFAYCGNDPVQNTDPNGTFWDLLFDLIFIAWDIYNLCTNDGYKNWENWVALAADIAFAVIPNVTGGGGQVVKVAKAGDKINDYRKFTFVGEGMNRVNAAALYYNVTDDIYHGYKNYSKLLKIKHVGDYLAEIGGKISNAAWLYCKLRSGYKVVDIGIDTMRLYRSSSYAMERMILFGWKYRNIWKAINHLF